MRNRSAGICWAISTFFHGWGSINPSHATMLSNSLIEVSMYLYNIGLCCLKELGRNLVWMDDGLIAESISWPKAKRTCLRSHSHLLSFEGPCKMQAVCCGWAGLLPAASVWSQIFWSLNEIGIAWLLPLNSTLILLCYSSSCYGLCCHTLCV